MVRTSLHEWPVVVSCHNSCRNSRESRKSSHLAHIRLCKELAMQNFSSSTPGILLEENTAVCRTRLCSCIGFALPAAHPSSSGFGCRSLPRPNCVTLRELCNQSEPISPLFASYCFTSSQSALFRLSAYASNPIKST